jgi:outer membrane protein TolC
VELDVERALALRPELAALEHEERRLEVERRFAENRALPELDLTVVASQDFDRDDPSPTKGEFELAAGLEMWLPVQRRAAQGQRLEATTRLEQLRLRRAFLRDKVQTDVRDAASALRAAEERAVQGLRDVELAGELARAERRAFELGNTTVLVLNIREEAAAEARDRLLLAQEEYWGAVADYEAAVGLLPR